MAAGDMRVLSADFVQGDCRWLLPRYPAEHFSSVVTDPPYNLGFMGKEWDKSGVAFQPRTWQAIARVARAGAYLLAFGGTRTFHRMACAIEDAGWELKDTLCWLYGSGFPKGEGGLKPAWEPVLLCRKPGPMVLPLGIDACRVPGSDYTQEEWNKKGSTGGKGTVRMGQAASETTKAAYRNGLIPLPSGRYPANVVHDGSEEVLQAFAVFGERGGGRESGYDWRASSNANPAHVINNIKSGVHFGDSGTAARFFYCAKASRKERGTYNTHPTVKPLALMRWLCRLVTEPGGLILDPFCGSGSTVLAATLEGMSSLGMELDPESVRIASRRLADLDNLID